MLKTLKSKNGFASVIEVVITAIIFVFAAVGIFTALSTLRPLGSDSTRRLEAVYAGKQVIEELRSQVDSRTWDNSSSLIAPNIVHTRTVGNYTINWWVTDVPGMQLRQVQMNIY